MKTQLPMNRLASLTMALLLTVPHVQALAANGDFLTLPVQPAVTDGGDSGTIIRLPVLPAPPPPTPAPNPNLPTPPNQLTPIVPPVPGSNTGPIIPGLPQNPGMPGNNGSPFNPPPVFNPTQPGMSGNGGRNMIGTAKSAYPGMTCALVDNRPQKELVTAIQNLTRLVIMTPECANNTDFATSADQAQKLTKAATDLQGMWAASGTATPDPKMMTDFQSNLATVLGGVSRITQTLNDDGFLGTKCGHKLLSAGGILMAVSDLATSVAPYAMLGAVTGSAIMAPALPYVLGVAGVGTVAKLFKTMHDVNTVDTTKPENRLALLQNICEFSKINQQIRFLQLASSGQLEEVTREINDAKNNRIMFLQSQYSFRVSTIVNIRNQVAESLLQSKKTLLKDQAELKAIQDQIGTSNNNSFICNLARDVATDVTDAEFPLRASLNLKDLVAKEKQPLLAQKVLLTSEERMRKGLLQVNPDPAKDTQECATRGKDYIDLLGKILQETDSANQKLSLSLQKELGKDPEFSDYQNKEQVEKNRTATVEKVASLLQRLNLDNAVLDKQETNAQLIQLRHALFSRPGALPWIGGSSPAASWLSFADEQYRIFLTEFKENFSQLIYDAADLTVSNRRMAANPWLVNPQDVKNMKSVQDLSIINADIVKDPTNKKYVCKKLEDIWINWASTMDSLAAQDFFCQSIIPFFDRSTESVVVSTCDDTRDLRGNILEKSGTKQQQEYLATYYQKKALMVSAKMKELSCQMPTLQNLSLAQ